MTSFQIYQKKKSLCKPWLQEIPQHWHECKLKHLFKERSQKGFPTEPLLAATQTQGVVTKKAYGNRTVEAMKDLHLLKLALPGDFVISLRSFQGGIEYTHDRGVISPAYTILIPSNKVAPSYFRYLFKSLPFLSLLKICVTGIREGQNINYNSLKQINTPLPPYFEQEIIGRFLDYKCAQINKFIQKKKRLIELLKEQKQAIINQAVTRGLDPHVWLKPSGIEWLGDIPEHWEVRKIGQLCKFNPSKSEAASLVHKDGMIRFLAMENITTEGDLINPPLKHISEVNSGFTYFKNGDVVIAKITPCFENGKGALIANLDSTCGFGTTELIVLRPCQSIQGSFLYWITRSSLFRLIGEKFMVGAAGQKRVPSTFIKGYPIALPPLDEQNNIINHIQAVTDNMNNCISRITKEISLIQEYRTRLISDVVTGQIDVRNIEISEMPENELIEEALDAEQEEDSLELVGAGDDD